MTSPCARAAAARALGVRLLWAVCLLQATPSAWAQTWDEHYRRGNAALEADRWEEAERELQAAVEKHPTPGLSLRTSRSGVRVDYHPYLQLAIACFHLGRYAEARTNLNLEEQHPAIPEKAEELLSRIRDLRVRIEAAEQASESARIASLVEEARAGPLEEAGDLDGALEAWARVLETVPDQPEATRESGRLAGLLEERRLASDADRLVLEGRGFLSEERYGEAVSRFEQALTLKPDHETAGLLLEQATGERDRQERAQQRQERESRRDRSMADATEKLREGDVEGARQRIDVALGLDPANEAVQAIHRDVIEAEQNAAREQQREREVADLLRRGREALDDGRLHDAEEAIDRALALDAGNPDALSLEREVAAARPAPEAPATGMRPVEIRFAPDRRASTDDDGTREERVSVPRLLLSGEVAGEPPIRLHYFLTHGAEEVKLQEEELTDRRTFRREFTMSRGVSQIRVEATDALARTTGASYQVRYAVPLSRSAWTYSIAGVVLAAAGVAVRTAMKRGQTSRRHPDLDSSSSAGSPGVAHEDGELNETQRPTAPSPAPVGVPLPSQPAAPSGLWDGRYELKQELGSGAMGVVYKAYDTFLEETIAVKILRAEYSADPAVLERFRREALLARDLGHPNILNAYDLGDCNGQRYLAMRWVEGTTLSKLLVLEGPLPVARGIDIATKLASALEAAHEKSIVHRDIKPQNILLDTDGEPVLSDFGLARLMTSPGVTRAGLFLGTPDYASPEQAGFRSVDVRSDVYSLGVVMFEMFTGRRPFVSESIHGLLEMHRETPAPDPRGLRPDLPEALSAAILRAMEKSPDDRFPSAGELRLALEAAREAER